MNRTASKRDLHAHVKQAVLGASLQQLVPQLLDDALAITTRGFHARQHHATNVRDALEHLIDEKAARLVDVHI